MTHESRNASIRDQASRLVLDIAADMRQQAQTWRTQANDADAKAALLEALAGHGRRVRAMHRIASRVQEGQTRPQVPTAIRRDMEKAAAYLDKLAAHIKAVPVTTTERTLKQVARRRA